MRLPRNDGFRLDSGPSRGDSFRRTIRPIEASTGWTRNVSFTSTPAVRFAQIALKNPLGRRERRAVATTVRAAEWGRSASYGEDGRRNGDELRQFPQVLGGGGQEELVFRSARATEAQSVEPEDALQMGEEHLDLLSFAT